MVAPIACLVALVAAQADVLIYSLSFSSTGETVNYSGIFNYGYVVVDEDAGSFSSILVLDDPETGVDYTDTSLLSGTFFDLLEDGNGDLYGVLSSGGGGNGTSGGLAFQVVGESSKTSIGGGATLRVPRKMKGFLLSNSEEITDVNEGGEPTLEFGFAGNSKVTARLDLNSTRDANDARLTPSATVTAILATLARKGVGPQPTPTATPTATATDRL
jgi:hypothetical protein